jgi:hypothetical protein
MDPSKKHQEKNSGGGAIVSVLVYRWVKFMN